MPIRARRLWTIVCFSGLAAAAGSAFALEADRDYYTVAATKDGRQTLRNVEEFHLGPAVEQMKTGHYENTRRHLEFVLRYFPNHPQALVMMSELCDEKWKSPNCAVDELMNRGIQRNPKVAQTWAINGMHLQRVKRTDAAIESYKTSIAINPSSANAHYNLGLAYFDNKQYDLANQEAQFAALLGFQLPGLRDKLTRVGQWKPLDAEELKRQMDSTYGSGATARNVQ